MQEYHKIQSVFKRDPETNYKTFLEEYTLPSFKYLEDKPWVGTEKVDGMNIVITTEGYWGRTEKAEIPGDLKPVLQSIQERMVEKAMQGLTLYGEGYGAGIQKGGQYRPDKSFVLFDVLGTKGFFPYVWPEEGVPTLVDIAAALDIDFVPELGTFSLEEWVDAIKGGWGQDSLLCPGSLNEGVVLRPPVELQNYDGTRVITKLKYKDFV